MEKPKFYKVVYESKPKPQKFEVICRPHGFLGTVAQVVLGLALFEAHRQREKGCMEASIKPIIKEVSFTQRFQMKRISKDGKR